MECNDHATVEAQKQLDKAMPWIGLYIAAASALCTLAMAADAFNGFRHKKLWFPCKYFRLNATSLTVLGVAMKLAMDLNTIMVKTATDWLAKHISTIFMSMVVANFMPSLGSMNDKEILANVVALGILVITMAADVVIQLFLLLDVGLAIFLFTVPSIFMLLLLATLVSLAITVPTTKRSLESKYQEKHKALREREVLKRKEVFTIDNRSGDMMKYWVMAETSSPQFVMARSVVCTTSALICLLALIMLAGGYVTIQPTDHGDTPYGNYTKWILYIQSTGVLLGAIAPTLRWLVAVSFKCSTASRNSLRNEIKIETYWTQNLVDLRDSFSSFHIRQGKYRKLLHDAKRIAITFCIGLQILIVLLSKLFLFVSALLMSPFFLCFTHTKKFVKRMRRGAAGGDRDLNDLSYFVLRLQDEAELPARVLKNICREADDVIQRGKKKQTRSLVDLLHKFDHFNGVGEFDQIPSLHSQEPPNNWLLPVVTLTSIAIALPNVPKHKCKQLLSSVREGLSLAKLVEKTLLENAQLVNIRKAADISWVGVTLYTKWLDVDLKGTSLECKNTKAAVQALSGKAENIVTEFIKREENRELLGDPPNWPPRVIAANSMHKISRTVLLSCEDQENEQTHEGLFERLSVMIADILAACLTNLPHVITTMCHSNAIETREKSVRKAFLLLGKTEPIIELLQGRDWPSQLDHDKAASIEEWRALFRQNKDDQANLASSDETVSAPLSSSEEHLAIKIDT